MNVQAFFETLAAIIGDRYGVKITAEVKQHETISTPNQRTERNGRV